MIYIGPTRSKMRQRKCNETFYAAYQQTHTEISRRIGWRDFKLGSRSTNSSSHSHSLPLSLRFNISLFLSRNVRLCMWVRVSMIIMSAQLCWIQVIIVLLPRHHWFWNTLVPVSSDLRLSQSNNCLIKIYQIWNNYGNF